MLAIIALLTLAATQTESTEAWRGLALPSLAQEDGRPEPFAALLSGRHVRLAGDAEDSSSVGLGAHLPPPVLTGLLAEDATRSRQVLRVEPGGPPLMVRGTPEALAGAERLCAELDRQGRALEIEISAWLTPGAARVGTHPSRAVFEAAVAGVEPLGRAQLRSGAQTALGVRHTQAFIGGFDVQIATGSSVAGPSMGQLYAGHTLHLRASRARAGRSLVLEGLLDLAELRELTEFDPDTRDLGRLQLPAVDVVQVAFAGAVESGGVLCVSVAGSALSQPDWTLWIEARGAGDAAGSWRVCDLALLEQAVFDLPLPQPGSGLASAERERATRTLLNPLGAAAVAQAADAAHASGARGVRAPIVWTSGLVLAPTSEAGLWREIEGLVSAAEAQHLRGGDISLQQGSLRVVLPALEGRPVRVLVGSEQVRLVGYELQVAQETWMPEPRVEPVFDGLLVQARLEGGALRGQAWSAASGPERILERESASLARVSVRERWLSRSGVAIEPGTGLRSVLPAAQASAGLELALEARPAGS